MLELEVVLAFACCDCGDPVEVTVKCTGKGLGLVKSEAALVKVPCPSCNSIIQAIFTPDDGHLLHVAAADKPRYMIPKPSRN